MTIAIGFLAGCQGGPSSADMAGAQAQAQAVLDRWAEAVAATDPQRRIVPVGELTGQIGDWEAALGDNKAALMDGHIVTMAPLPANGPAEGDVEWADGTNTTVPLLSAQDALDAIRTTATGECIGCIDKTTLVVTDAELISGPIQTSRGPATGPLWSFTIQGTAVKVTRVAIANAVTVQRLEWASASSSVGLYLDSATASAAQAEVTVAFVGAPNPGNQPCGEDYTAEPVESDLAIVVIVVRHPNSAIASCTGLGATRTAVATLTKALGDRVVLNLGDGLPVLTMLAP